MALALEYRGLKCSGRQWLAERWPERFVLVIAAGAFVGLGFGILPIQLYRVGKAFIGLYRNPPTPLIVLALLPFLVGGGGGIWIMGAAHRARLKRRDQRQSGMAVHAGWSLALASCFWLLATFSIGGGFVASFLLIRGL
ncbi:hypothetical protein LB545_29830 [Mesorhizobium sp. BR1-1-6]|uniref:hypothetical protein n=1 Tax=Mesorhizobium sp. BR1-1-6 TaxID=2876648 RepID=UPI001CD10ACC|nr:hypothetical protein [Mesorhizobium sp. BR1-1-6]MBZ9898515.1 hypothetical protein [Mesorhizobium sp. BR1-1-6]